MYLKCRRSVWITYRDYMIALKGRQVYPHFYQQKRVFFRIKRVFFGILEGNFVNS